jgi:riboflavin kinase
MSYPSNNLLPIRMISKVVRGFGRGSKDLGIPTANLSKDKDKLLCTVDDFNALPTGIYWGFARIGESSDNENAVLGRVHTAAISIGYNPTYNNEEKTVEPHLIADEAHPSRHASSTGETQFVDFYDKTIVLSVVGFLRHEQTFEGSEWLEKLVDAIKKDINDSLDYAKEDSPIILAEKQWVASASDLQME